MRIVFLCLIVVLSGCTSIGPKRLKEDCSWDRRPETTAENIAAGIGVSGVVLGWPGFLYGFVSSKPTVSLISFSAIVGGTLLLWHAIGATEEIPFPYSRYKKCSDTIWGKP